MTIRLIARDLYRLRREVEGLEAALEKALPAERADIEDRLRKTRAEMNGMRRILDGEKEPPSCRRPR